MAKRIIHVDMTLCMGCETCESVCEFIHGEKLIRVYEPERGLYVPLTCRHCERAPCIEVCPTNALYRDDDGAVLVNPARCIGCMMCAAVCPFGIPQLSPKTRKIVKCDMCHELRVQGLPPACAQMCPATAIVFGSLEEIGDRIRTRTAEVLARVKAMRPLPRSILR